MDYRYSNVQSMLNCVILGICLTITGMIDGVYGGEVTVVPLHRDVPAARLSCWACQHSQSSPNPDCVSMRNKTRLSQVTCNLHEPFCRVRKLMNDGHVEMLERSCTQGCAPGCEKNINKVQVCTACCVHILCNTGSDANIAHVQRLLFLVCVYISTFWFTKDYVRR